ncbi:hypothetical protein ACA758_02065 [Mycoplasmopsis agassizii]|uniref:hypothetical protein n=1 Tax=Mycoplasmopsis agassizii TaxID=33922 RepID=UPI0035288CD7
MTSRNNFKTKSKKDELAISKIDYILKEVHLVEKFNDDRTKYKLIYEVIGELKEREETVIIDGGDEKNSDTSGWGDDNSQGGDTNPKPSNDPEWKIYMNKVRDELREEFHKELDTGLNELRQEFSQELSKTEIRLLKVINENNEKTNKRIDGIEDTLKQILSILKDKK